MHMSDHERRRKKVELYQILLAGYDVTHACQLFLRFRQSDGGMNYPVNDPVFQTAVVTYARPFKWTRPYGSLPKQWARFPDPMAQATHDFLIKIRDRYVAHADLRSVEIYPRGVPLPDGTPAPDVWFVTITTLEATIPFDRVITLCSDLARRLRAEGGRVLKELYAEREDLPAAPFKLNPDDDF